VNGAAVAWAVEALAASAFLIALVLIVRGPARRTFGASVAYALWALPVLRLVLPPLPATVRESVAAPLTTPFIQVGQQVTVWVSPDLAAPAADSAAAAPLLTAGMTLALLWVAGAAAFLGWHLVSYLRFRQRLLARATLVDRIDGVTVVESAAAAGPLAFGIARRYVAFPRDFAARYDADERQLALAHELGHHARGDLVANWVALAVLALHWFNPLAWYAFRAFRADQEMANDARVLAQLGHAARHAYACAIVKAAHGGAIAAACHLHTVDDLKGRLRMLGLNRTSRGRAVTGMVAVASVGLGALALTASGTQAAESVRAKVEDAAAVVALARPVAAAAAQAAKAPADTRVVIVEDGKRRVYEGAEAAAWVAAHPVPAPPIPPVPAAPSLPSVAWRDTVPPAAPVPPIAPAPPVAASEASAVIATGDGITHLAYSSDRQHGAAAPEVRSAACGGDVTKPVVVRDEQGGKRRITICTDRIERAARAGDARAYAAKAHHAAMNGALAGMRSARRAISANRHMSEQERESAVADLDREIERMEEERDES
jgi:beta-lactamase regulating signal transducer with metallopeptidase domain